MTKFEFFVSNGVPAPANSAARSHAIKTALQLRSKTVAGEDSQGGAADSQRTAQSKSGLSGRFRLGPTSTKSSSGKPETKSQRKIRGAASHNSKEVVDSSLIVSFPSDINSSSYSSNYLSGIEWLGGNYFDPFRTTPIPWNPRIDALLKHCIVGFDYLTTTVPSQRTWLALAISDPLLMRITLCMAAAFRATQVPVFSPELRKEGWKLKGEGINGVNLSLQQGRVTEKVLAAIALLGHIASLEGSFQEADIHFQGLHRLVALRGGIQSIEAYQVGRFINGVDLELATALGRKPFYHLNYGLERVQLPPCITETCELPSQTHLRGLGPGHKTVIVVTQLLRQRVMTVKYQMDQTLRDVRALSFSAALLALNHVADTPTTPEDHCIHTLLLATHFYGCAALNQHNHWTKSLPWIISRRIRELLKFGPKYTDTWANYLPELFWILFICAVVSERDPRGQETWFLSQLEVVWQLLRCKKRLELEAYLHSMIWDDDFGIQFLDDWCQNHNL